MKKITVLSTSVTVVLALALNGCGGGSSTSANGTNITGKAIDPYLNGSTVCLDLNDNGVCEVSEPTTHTDEHGDYALTVAEEHVNAHHALIVSGGTDTGTNTVFKGTLSAVEAGHTSQNITPLTTLVEARYQYCETDSACHETLDEITVDLASYLGVTKEQINADIVKLANNGNDEPLKTALALEVSAESHYAAHPYEFYKKMGEHGFPAEGNWRNDIQTFLSTKEYGVVAEIMNIDRGVLENAGITVEDDAGNAGVEAGNDTANAGESSGEEAHASTAAGSDAANTGVTAGDDTANTESTYSMANAIAHYTHGLLNDTANTGAQAGTDATNTDVTAGEDAGNTGVEAGNDATDTGVQDGSDATDTGIETGSDAGNTGVTAGEDTANTSVPAGTSSAL